MFLLCHVRYYHSQYDTGAALSQDSDYEDVASHLTRLATTVARMLYQTSTGSKHHDLHANESLVSTSHNTAAFFAKYIQGVLAGLPGFARDSCSIIMHVLVPVFPHFC